MVERIRSLLERFPENEEAVQSLIAADEEFSSLCQEYAGLTEELRHRQQESPAEDAAGLRARRNAVEERLLRKMEGYEPV